MNPDGVALPAHTDPAKEDPKALLLQISKLNQQISVERQNAAQTLISERAKCKAEMDKLRQTTHARTTDLQNQNSALIESLGRMKAEKDELQKQLIILQYQRPEPAVPRAQSVPVEPSHTLPIVPSSLQLSGEEIPPAIGREKSHGTTIPGA